MRESQSLAQLYAARKGWNLLRGNVMVEGTADVAYFELASNLYERDTRVSLVGKDLSFFPAGLGDAGGTYGICEQYPTLLNVVHADPDPNGKLRFRVIALFDKDTHGKNALRMLTKSNRSIRENSNAFLLHYCMPRKSRDSKPLGEHIAAANAYCSSLDCEIEDLLNDAICVEYAAQFPHHLARTTTLDCETHRDWTVDGKRGLLEFARDVAILSDVVRIVDAIKSLRFYLGLPTDGAPA